MTPPERSSDRPRRGRRWRWPEIARAGAIAAALALLAAVSFRVAAVVPAGVFFSVDGGTKLLMTDQLARGVFERDLHPRHEDELGALWRRPDTMFVAPPGTNFVHRIGDELMPGFPWSFPAVTAPLYALLGPPGLYVLPMAALFGVWGLVVWIAVRSRWGLLATLSALATVSVASPLVLYGAMFWEHTLGVALAFAGFAELALPVRSERSWRRAAALGACLGAAFWFRPETAPFAAAVVLVFAGRRWRERERVLAFAASALVVAVGYVALNYALYGRPFGYHADQALAFTWSERLDRAVTHGRTMGEQILDWSPVAWAYLPLFGAIVTARPLMLRRGALEAALTLPLFIALALLVLPNTGGHSLGARYLLLVYPLLAVMIGAFVDRATERPGPALVLVALVLGGLALSTVEVFDRRFDPAFRTVYERDVGPVHDAVVGAPGDALLVFDQAWFAAHLSGAHGDRRVLSAPDPERLRLALERARARGVGVIVVSSSPDRPRFARWLAGVGQRLRRGRLADVHYVPAERVDAAMRALDGGTGVPAFAPR